MAPGGPWATKTQLRSTARIVRFAATSAERGHGRHLGVQSRAGLSVLTVLYELPHGDGFGRLRTGRMTEPWRLSASETTALATATAAYRSGAVTVTTLMTLSARCALMMLADLLQAA
jgi:hypothetical protein